MISFVTESEFINFTLVAKDQVGSEAEGLNVVSFYQASSATPTHYQARFDDMLDDLNDLNDLNDMNCKCVTQNVELTHRTFETRTSLSSSLAYAGVSVIDKSTTLFEAVNVCGTLEGIWPLSTFSVLGTDIKGKAIGAAGFIENYAVDEGVWQLSALEVADNFELNQPYQKTSSVQLINNVKHFSTLVIKEELPFF